MNDEPEPQKAQTTLPSSESEISEPSRWDHAGFRGFLEVVSEDFHSNQASILTPGFQALLVHRMGCWVRSNSFPALLRPLATVIHRFFFVLLRNYSGYEIAPTARLGRRIRVYHQNGIVIHGRAVIGDECVLMHGVTLGTRSGAPAANGRDAPRIGARVTLGVGCTILGPVVVADDASVGPHALVTTDVPAGASVVAPPSRIIRLRRS